MLETTRVSLRTFAPETIQPISRSVTARVSESAIEFGDVLSPNLSGDPFRLVCAQFDVFGTQLSCRGLESGAFPDVADETGVNGNRFTLDALGAACRSIGNARAG